MIGLYRIRLSDSDMTDALLYSENSVPEPSRASEFNEP